MSSAVVSYVMNNGPRPVAETTRARVLAAVDELGYRPNAVARALKVHQTKSIGLLIPDSSNPYFAELAQAVEDAAFARGYALLLANSHNDPARELSQLSALRARQVDGLLLISTTSGEELAAVGESGTPAILLDRVPSALSLRSVTVDNEEGAFEATRHLIETHGRMVSCFAGPTDVPAARERERGWRRAMESAGLDPDPLITRTAFGRTEAYRAMSALMDGGDAPAAVFASSDAQAVGILRAAYENHLVVPNDLAMISFDGTRESEFTTPPSP